MENYFALFNFIYSFFIYCLNKKMFMIPKGVIKSRKSKKDMYRYDGQKKRDKMTNNDLKNTTQKTNTAKL
jgi:hypothetical protein